jgi:hypothetical protein
MIFKLEFLISLTVQKKKKAFKFQEFIGSPVIQNSNWKRHKIAEGCNPSIFLIEDAINHRPSSERYSTNASGPVV